MAVEVPSHVGEGLKSPFKMSVVISKGIDIITPERTLDIFSSLFRYIEAPGYRAGLLHYLALGYYPVGFINHYVHFDGVGYKLAAENIVAASQALEDSSKRIRAGYGLHQGTMESGDQGEELQTYTLKLEDAAGEKGLLYLPWTTPEHMKRYNYTEAQKERAKQQNEESAAKIKEAPSKRIALLTFPAGNMKSARDPLKGMGESDLTWITQMAVFIRDGVKIVWLPGVIQESFRISDPNTRNLTPEAAWSFARNLFARSSLPIRPSEAKLASLTMLPPYPVDRLALDLAQVTGRHNINVRNLRLLSSTMHAQKEITDRLLMGIINDELPGRFKGSYYEGYRSFGLGNYAETLYPIENRDTLELSARS